MEWSIGFFIVSIALGISLAMDAFSVSLANGLNEPNMKSRHMCIIAGVFAFFQALMPMLGWVCVYFFVTQFKMFQPFIPWIALALLLFIGIKMLVDGIKDKDGEEDEKKYHHLTFKVLLVQGIATSIDALSVGFTFVEEGYNWLGSLVCSLIISAVTFGICITGVLLGKKFGTKLAGKATILGGTILIIIGIVIFVKGMGFLPFLK